MPLVHLPVQSGSNKILKEMNRKHSIEEYLNIIKDLKKSNRNIKFSSDFIIGYPGETKKDFEDTLHLLKEVKFINTYSFIFSPRPGTPAARLETVNEKLSKERLKIFQKAASEIKMQYRKSLINSFSNVIFENRIKNTNQFFGRDKYLNSVITKSKENLIGETKDIKIIEGNQNTLYGEIRNTDKRDYAA